MRVHTFCSSDDILRRGLVPFVFSVMNWFYGHVMIDADLVYQINTILKKKKYDLTTILQKNQFVINEEYFISNSNYFNIKVKWLTIFITVLSKWMVIDSKFCVIHYPWSCNAVPDINSPFLNYRFCLSKIMDICLQAINEVQLYKDSKKFNSILRPSLDACHKPD